MGEKCLGIQHFLWKTAICACWSQDSDWKKKISMNEACNAVYLLEWLRKESLFAYAVIAYESQQDSRASFSDEVKKCLKIRDLVTFLYKLWKI